MAQQTVVEFLLSKIIDTNASKNGDVLLKKLLLNNDIEQAKKLHEKQIIAAYIAGQNNGYEYRDGKSSWQGAGEWYNKTHENK